MAEEEKTILLTQEAYDKMKQELEYREGQYRDEITERIAAARAEGDLSENGGYQAAREEQSKLEGRILELTHLLESAHVSEPPSAEVVGPGTVITASIAGLEERFLLGSREAAEDIEGIEVYPEGAPLGQAIMGLKAGDKTSFKAPNGRSIPVEVIKIESFEG